MSRRPRHSGAPLQPGTSEFEVVCLLRGIKPANMAGYIAPYEAWERELVAVLDRLPRTPLHYGSVHLAAAKPNLCHHNVRRYCHFDFLAKPILGWVDDGAGYVLHSVVEIAGLLYDVTPCRYRFPFVCDAALQIRWEHRMDGDMRATITRSGRILPGSLRTPAVARQWRRWAGYPG